MQKIWNDKKRAIKALDYFDFLSDEQLLNACKICTLKEYKPLDTIYSQDRGTLTNVHFVLSGECVILQCLNMKVKIKNGRKKRHLLSASEDCSLSMFGDVFPTKKMGPPQPMITAARPTDKRDNNKGKDPQLNLIIWKLSLNFTVSYIAGTQVTQQTKMTQEIALLWPGFGKHGNARRLPPRLQGPELKRSIQYRFNSESERIAFQMTATNLPRVPDGLRDLVKNYTKEVLREKPEDLYKFSVGYFEGMAGRRTKKKVLKYEPQQSYESIMKNRNRQQLPLSLAFHIIPQNLTEIIKQFIKAVLRENPQDIVLFAVEHFRKLLQTSSGPHGINYSTYEKYLDESRSAPPAPKVKCECGRILSSKDMRIQVEANPTGQATQALDQCNGDQHLRAVVTIQKCFRRYLRRRAERSVKVTPKAADAHESVEVLNAVLLIQRQIRRLLKRKRAKMITESRSQSMENLHSIKHLKSVLIIQRHIREYLKKKKSLKQSLSHSERNMSFTNAAFVIQRAFRRAIRARRAKVRKTGEPEQIEEVNDTASEAASYTSASTALLSTESAGDHDFGPSNYEDAVHQQTIKEDEEVDNDNAYNRKYIKARPLQSSAKSTYSDAKADMINNNVNGSELTEIENENEDNQGLENNSKVDETSKLLEAKAKGEDHSDSDDNNLRSKEDFGNNIPTANEETIKQEFIDLQMEHLDPLRESNKFNLSGTNMGIVADSTRTDEVPEDKDGVSSWDIKDSQSVHENLDEQDASCLSEGNSTDCNNQVQGTKGEFDTPKISGENFRCDSNEAQSSDNMQSIVERMESVETEDIADGAAISESSPASRESEKMLRTDVTEQSVDAKNPMDDSNSREHQSTTEQSITKLDLPNENLMALPECQQSDSSSGGTDMNLTDLEGEGLPLDVNLSEIKANNSISESKSCPKLESAINSSIEQNLSVETTEPSQQLESQSLEATDTIGVTNEESMGDNILKSPDCVGENVLKSSESVGNNILKSSESVVDNILKSPDSVDDNISKSSESVGDNILKSPDSVGDNILKSSESVGNNILKSSESVGNNILKSSESVGDNILKSPDSVGDNVSKSSELKSPDCVGENVLKSPDSVGDNILKSRESRSKSSGDGISQISLSRKVDVNMSSSNANMTANNMEDDPEDNRYKSSSETLTSEDDDSESFLALKKFAEEIKEDFNKVSQMDSEPDQSKDSLSDHKNQANSTEPISHENNNEISVKGTITEEVVDQNQLSPENQYSIEVSSLQTVLKNLHNHQKNGQSEVSEKYESTSSNVIIGHESRSPTLLDPLSVSEASEDNNIVTTIIIHSVLPTEGDYELRLSSPIPISVDSITASESSGSNLSSFKDVIESTTSEEDLTVIEKDKNLDMETQQSSPNNRVDQITSSTLDASETQDENVATEKNTSSEDPNSSKSELGNRAKDTINESPVEENLGTTETSIDPVATEQQFDEPRQTESRIVSEVENKQLAANDWNTEKTLLIESNDSNDQNHGLMKDTESHISNEKNGRFDSSETSPSAPVYSRENSCDERDENAKVSSANTSESKEEICSNDVEVGVTESTSAETVPTNCQQDDGQSGECSNNLGIVNQPVSTDDESPKLTNQTKDAGKTDDLAAEVNTALSNQIIGSDSHAVPPNKLKKMPAVKEKQLSKLTSNRLIQTPIAELQLKSFKVSAEEGQWYEVHSENAMDATKGEDHQITEKRDSEERKPNGKPVERSPRYLYGDQIESSETVKHKQSVSFFISFDSNSDRPSFRIPKRFLRATDNTSPTMNAQNGAQSEEDADQASRDVNYQEFGKPKLQTIHELNENESANDLLTDTNNVSYTGDLAHTNLPDCSNEEKLAEKDGYVSKQIDSANIIKRAFRQYKDRQTGVKDGIGSNEGKTIGVSQSDSAMKIQRAFRKFLAKRKSESGHCLSKHYTASEIMAAMRIQNVFRDFIRRKRVAKPEWFVGSQRISLLPGESTEIGTDGKTDETVPDWDTQGNGSGELATDIGNNVNELSAGKASETYNGPSHNLAGATNEAEFDIVQEVEAAARSPSDAAPIDKINRTRAVINEFLDQEIRFSSESMQKIGNNNEALEEVREEQCVKRKVSLSNLDENNSDAEAVESREEDSAVNNDTQGELDTLEGTSLKLSRTDKTIEKMSKRRSLEIREKEERKDFQIAEPVFDEPLITPLSLLQEQNSLDIDDGEIVYSRLQREDTRESSAQSENVVFGNTEEDRIIPDGTDIGRSQLSRHYTIAGDDPKTVFKSVITSDTVKLMSDEHGMDGASDGPINSSFCLDDETSENIRQKIMAYSLSEADSDYYDSNKAAKDDFHVDTAMTDAMDTSTETESTIVSAAAKIQAGARGFLTRRRLRRASAGTTSSTQETKASFGNDAISESLERIIEEEAARKIQAAFRYHSRKPKKPAEIPESMSLENNLAAKRQTLQRGDALQNDSNSTPEDENEKVQVIVGSTSGLNTATESRLKKNNDSRLSWSGLRQNSMPVQIDCEVLRLVPKHKRRRIKSAQDKKQRARK